MKKLILLLTLLCPAICLADTIQWQPVDGAAGYKLVYANGDERYEYDNGTSVVCDTDNLNLSTGKRYFIYVQAYDANGVSGKTSDTVVFSTRTETQRLEAPARVRVGK